MDLTHQPLDAIYAYFGAKVNKLQNLACCSVIFSMIMFRLRVFYATRKMKALVRLTWLETLFMQVAIYFAFLGMYTQWLIFPAALGIILNVTHQGSVAELAIKQ